MRGGFIMLFRSMTDWEWYSDPVTKAVFLDLLLTANYEDGSFRGVEVKRGQAVIGRKEMAQRLGISEQNVRTALKKLQSTGEIKIEKAVNKVTKRVTNRFSLVTVEKWGFYQGYPELTNQKINPKVTRKQPECNLNVTTSKKGINKKNNKEIILKYELDDEFLDREV